jgi:hypothetical protein
MILDVETITPNEAEAWLRKSEGQIQRTPSSALVAKLAHAITAGQWQLTHQGIALDDAGVVLDGQHRLQAIIRAGIPVQMIVARGVDPDTFGAMDTGRSRNTGDALKIAGYTNGPLVAAAARYLLAYDRAVGTTFSLRTFTREVTTIDVLNLLETERGQNVMHAASVAERIAYRGFSRPGFRTWMTAGIVVLHEGPPADELVLEFLERMHDGAGLPAGSPMLALRRYLMSDAGLVRIAHGYRGDVGIAVTIKAFNAWNAHETRALMTFKPGIEPMPAVLPVMPGGFLAN